MKKMPDERFRSIIIIICDHKSSSNEMEYFIEFHLCCLLASFPLTDPPTEEKKEFFWDYLRPSYSSSFFRDDFFSLAFCCSPRGCR